MIKIWGIVLGVHIALLVAMIISFDRPNLLWNKKPVVIRTVVTKPASVAAVQKKSIGMETSTPTPKKPVPAAPPPAPTPKTPKKVDPLAPPPPATPKKPAPPATTPAPTPKKPVPAAPPPAPTPKKPVAPNTASCAHS